MGLQLFNRPRAYPAWSLALLFAAGLLIGELRRPVHRRQAGQHRLVEHRRRAGQHRLAPHRRHPAHHRRLGHGGDDPLWAGGTMQALLHFKLGTIPAGASVVSGSLTLTEKKLVSAIKSLTVSTAKLGWSEATASWAGFGAVLREWLSHPVRLKWFNIIMAVLLVLSLWPMLK